MRSRITAEKFSLDITNQQLTLQEENSRFSDRMFSKFSFPFTVEVNEEILNAIGDYTSHDVTVIQKEIPVWIENEDKISAGKLNLMSAIGNKLTGQLDFGIEEVPNFSTKLNELTWLKMDVPDIHTYGPTVFAKKYPETVFNYPRIWTKKYDPTTPVWDAFNGYINATDLAGVSATFRKNYIDAAGNIFNVNIIHPCPHLLYILKEGFKQGGYQLTGDVLMDPILQDLWVFSGTDYFSSKQQRRFQVTIDSTTLIKEYPAYYTTQHEFDMSLDKSGKYKLNLNLRIVMPVMKVTVLLNGSMIYEQSFRNFHRTDSNNVNFNFDFNAPENSILHVIWMDALYMEQNNPGNAVFLLTSNALSDIQNGQATDESGVITNRNEIDLARAMPDMTFGEFVVAFKNYFNYDFTVSGNKIISTALRKENPFKANDFTKYEVAEPERIFGKQLSFIHKFPDFEEKLDFVYYDKSGIKINGTKKDDTNIIEVKGYPMPVRIPKNNGKMSAITLTNDSNLLQLISYAGTATDNAPKVDSRLVHPNLFVDQYEPWCKQRLTSTEYRWKFFENMNVFSQFGIKEYCFCYKRIHAVKSWTKTKATVDTYQVEIVTETFA